jgi:hypothetical protein
MPREFAKATSVKYLKEEYKQIEERIGMNSLPVTNADQSSKLNIYKGIRQ